MRIILFLFTFFISASLCAQQMPDYGLNRVRIIQADKIILAEIKPLKSSPDIKSNLFYYWYDANQIHSSQGGFSGKLLNGQYAEFYLNKNLKQQGVFKKGLKDGVWKSWNEDGTLSAQSTWKNGAIVTVSTVSFWDKLNVFKRKPKDQPADSLIKKTKQ